MKTIKGIILFIVTIPFKIFKYGSLAFYYIIGLIVKETPEKKKAREEKEKQRQLELEKAQEKAKEYLLKNKASELKFSRDNNSEDEVRKDKPMTKEEKREEHRLAMEKIRREKLRQKEEERKEHKNLFSQLKTRNFFAERRQKKLEEKAKVLSMDVTAAESTRSDEKIVFNYIAKNPSGIIEKGTLQGYSKLDIHSYLLAEGYEVYEITSQSNSKILKMLNTDLGVNRAMKKSSLVFYLTQLSTYLRAGIPVVDSIKLLASQAKTRNEKIIWKSVVYDLTMGATLSDSMNRCGSKVFPRLLINMIKTAEMTGELPDVLDEQVDYYKQIEKTRKEMINALIYPIFVLVFAVIIVVYIMVSVVPQFVDMYNSINADLPGITVFMINASDFLRNNIILIVLLTFIIIFSIIFAYRKSIMFKASLQRFAMHLPVFGQIIIYNEVTMFTKTFATLINNNIFITDSMDILSRITENEIYKGIIYDAVDSLSKGDVLSSAFKDKWAFPNIAYQMIVTGEKTGQLGTMMEKVAEYYQNEHTNSVARVKALVEPIVIIFLAVVVGGILLAVVIPMFSLYSNVV